MIEKSYDLIIVGGGIIGKTLAVCLLQKIPALKILILEAQNFNQCWQTLHYHHRVSALTSGTVRFLTSLNLWQFIHQKRVSPFTNIYVNNEDDSAAITFCAQDIGERQLGYIVENNLLELALQSQLALLSNVTFLAKTQLVDFVETSTQVMLKTLDGNSFTAKIAIASDGAHSFLREAAKISVKRHDYQETALVTRVVTEKPHERCARQIFLKSGPLAFLPLMGAHDSSIVWTLTKDEAEAMLTIEKSAFLQVLGAQFKYQLGQIEDCEKLHHFRLFRQQANVYTKGRVVLVGDAAHVLHPLAGQGINQGMQDVNLLVHLLNEVSDIDNLQLMRRYARRREMDNLSMMYGIDAIKKLLNIKNSLLKSMVNFGMNKINHTEWLKNLFTHYAVNYRGLC